MAGTVTLLSEASALMTNVLSRQRFSFLHNYDINNDPGECVLPQGHYSKRLVTWKRKDIEVWVLLYD